MESIIKICENIAFVVLLIFTTFIGTAIVFILFDLIFQVFTNGNSLIREVIAPFLNRILGL